RKPSVQAGAGTVLWNAAKDEAIAGPVVPLERIFQHWRTHEVNIRIVERDPRIRVADRNRSANRRGQPVRSSNRVRKAIHGEVMQKLRLMQTPELTRQQFAVIGSRRTV